MWYIVLRQFIGMLEGLGAWMCERLMARIFLWTPMVNYMLFRRANSSNHHSDFNEIRLDYRVSSGRFRVDELDPAVAKTGTIYVWQEE